MKLQYFNPLRDIFKYKSAPHAITLRSSLQDKFFHAVEFFTGQSPLTEKGHVGFFDWLTLGIPLGLLQLSSKLGSLAEDNSLYKIPKFFLNLINYPLLFIRFVSSFILAIVTLPITMLVHAISSVIAEKYMKLASQAHIVTLTNENNVARVEMLDTFIKNDKQLPDSWLKATEGNSFKLILGHGDYEFDINNNKLRVHPNAVQLEAMYKLNLFDMAQNMERRGLEFVFNKSSDKTSTEVSVEQTTFAGKVPYKVSFPQTISGSLEEQAALFSNPITESYFTFTR